MKNVFHAYRFCWNEPDTRILSRKTRPHPDSSRLFLVSTHCDKKADEATKTKTATSTGTISFTSKRMDQHPMVWKQGNDCAEGLHTFRYRYTDEGSKKHLASGKPIRVVGMHWNYPRLDYRMPIVKRYRFRNSEYFMKACWYHGAVGVDDPWLIFWMFSWQRDAIFS